MRLATEGECLKGVAVLLLLEVHVNLSGLNGQPIAQLVFGSAHDQLRLAQILLNVIARQLIESYLDLLVANASLFLD